MGMQQVTLSTEVIEEARNAAQGLGISLADYISESLRMRRAADRQIDYLNRRAARADVGAVLELLRHAPDVPPDEGDEMPGREIATVPSHRT